MQLLSFKNWNIFNKILGMVVITVLPFLLILQFYFLPSVEESLLRDKRLELTHLVESSFSVMADFNKQANSGSISLAEAQQKVKDIIQTQRFDGNNYLFITNDKTDMVMHPITPELNGTDLEDKKDPNGVYLFREFSKIAKSQGEGFVDYYWEKPGHSEPVPKISYVKYLEDWGWILGAGLYVDDIDAEVSSLTNSIYLSIVIVTIFVVLFGIFLARMISSPIKQLEEAAKKVAGGDNEVRVSIDTQDETGRLATSFNKMVESLKISFEEVQLKSEAAEKAAADAEEAQAAAEEQRAYLSESTNKMLEEMNKFSDGDLTTHLEVKTDDAIGQLFKGYNLTVDRIRELVLQITEAVEATASASTQISSSAEEMAAGAEEQSAQTSEVAAAVEQMTQTIIQTSQNASNAATSAEDTSNKATEGVKKLNENKEGMVRISTSAEKTGTIISSLTSKTDQIGEIAQVIDDIADQTNLLALNAAIEAARAGEQGRGFAVVADEVKKLAERTTTATKEIAETIKAIQKEAKDANESMGEAKGAVEDGFRLTEETEAVFNKILESTQNLFTEINQVAAASEEQSSGAEQISKNVEGINTVSQQAASSVQQVAHASEDLNRLTENLQALITRFKIAQNNGQRKLDYGANNLLN